MRLRAPLIAAALLGSAVAVVWFTREEPVARAPQVSSPPALPVELPAADDAAPPPQQRTANDAARAEPELPRSPLNLGRAPFGIDEGFPQLAHSERAFAAEPIDESWARGQEAEVLGKISQLQGLALLDLRVECRSRMCRIQMAQPLGQAEPPFRDVAAAIGMEPQWVMSLAGPGGSLNTVGYLWRDGYAPARPGLRTNVGDPDQAP